MQPLYATENFLVATLKKQKETSEIKVGILFLFSPNQAKCYFHVPTNKNINEVFYILFLC